MSNKQKKCLVCGDTIQGRVDKRYCSDSCRSSYHNDQNRDTVRFVRNINRILKENRRILLELNPKGKTAVLRSRMLERGFKFSYFTNEYRARNGNIYHFCYEQGYLVNDKEYVTLVKRQEYVE